MSSDFIKDSRGIIFLVQILHLYFRKQSQMGYYTEDESNMGKRHIKNTNKKLMNNLTNEISAVFDKSKVVAN